MNISDSVLMTDRFIQINVSINKCCSPLYSKPITFQTESFPFLSYLISESNPAIDSAGRVISVVFLSP